MFLEVVALARDVGRDLGTAGQPDTGHLAQWLAGQTDQLGAVEAISGDEFEGAYEADVIDLATAAPAESPEVG